MFFGYFLNTKKVTPSADSVIGPAKAGDFPLFPHAASVPAPALASIQPHFAYGETGLAGHRPHRGRRFAVPVTAAPRRGPNGKTPALAPVRSHFACGETGLAGRCPRRGQRARCPIFALLKCGPALAPRRSAPFHPKTIVRFRMSVSPEFSVFFICPPPFFCIGSGAHRYTKIRGGDTPPRI